MNKSPQYNQQTEPKQCKPEGEERCIHKNLETDPVAATRNVATSQQPGNWLRRSNQDLKINSGFHARENLSEVTVDERSQIRELHETINF